MDSRLGTRMRVLSNEDVDRLLTMPECIAVLEEMYRDYAHGEALLNLVPRIDNLSPSTEPVAYYGFTQMGGAWPRRRVQALRITSDIITHPIVAGTPRRVKQPKADGRWVGLVFLFSSETGALVLDKARVAGLGHELPDDWFSETVHP